MRDRVEMRVSSRTSLALAVAAACLVLILRVGVAAAVSTLPLLGSFGTKGAGASQLNLPRGLAVDLSGDFSEGDVYVADQGNQRIEKFGSVGNFILAFGRDVNATKVKEAEEGKAVSEAEEDVCTASAGDICTSGEGGAGNVQFHTPLGVAVDPSSGDVYVEDFSNHRVEKYTPAGELLLMFGGDVNATTGGDVCTATEVCQAGVTAPSSEPGEGKFHAWGVGALLAVGSSGTVYVGDENRVQEFNSAGVYQSQIELPGTGKVTALAVDPAGNVYVKVQLVSGVGEYDSAGTLLRTFDEGSETVKAVALDRTRGDVYVIDIGEEHARVFQYDSSGSLLSESASGAIEASTGIAANASGTVYASELSTGKVLLFGSPPSEGNPPPAIDAEFAGRAGTDSAELGAEINPEFLATTYYVQYGTTTSYSEPAVPAPPGVALEATNLGDDAASVSLEGLTPGTTYHYRFVAHSQAGTTVGPDRTFTARQSGPFALADSRAFELVSPPEKNSAEVGVPDPAGTGPVETVLPVQASSEGEAITYGSFTAFGAAQSAPATSQYLSKRGGTAWSTQNLSPPDEEGYTRDPLRGFSPDLSTGVVIQREPVLAEGVAGFENLYLRDDTSGGLRALTTVMPRVSPGEPYCVAYAGASADFHHVIFMANGGLTVDAPEGPGFSLYEWSPPSGLRLVSVRPDNTPAQPSGATGFGAGRVSGCDKVGTHVLYHAISDDGSQIIWTYVNGFQSELLAREDGSTTTELDAPQGVSGAGGGGHFMAASADGTKVFFTDNEQLTNDAVSGSGTSLYEYDFDKNVGERLTDLTLVPAGKAAEALGVLGASEDGSYVYFAARGVLKEGATLGQDNLYVWHAGEGTRFIATLSETHTRSRVFGEGERPGDGVDWEEQPKKQTARVTPDGHHLALVSVASLTGYDNTDRTTGEPDSEVYIYDAETAKLACTSCNASGTRPIGPANVPGWSTPYRQPRYISDDGGRVFFDSFDALALHATNGMQNVYEWERSGLGSCTATSTTFSASSGGCVFPISTGTSTDNSYFLDASAEGRDAFFSTRQGLVPWDQDERYDVYDAREGGGLPPPPSPPPACSGEACRSASSAGPVFGPPVSVTFSGAGNLAPLATPASESKPSKPKALTRAQKLVAAVNACKKKPRKKRAACLRHARATYGSKSKPKSHKRGK